MGLFVSDPDEFGIKATDEQMEDFVHNWRVMGHLLGCKRRIQFVWWNFKNHQRSNQFD